MCEGRVRAVKKWLVKNGFLAISKQFAITLGNCELELTELGLAIVRQIVVEKHRGILSVDSIPGHGTKFTIEIPVTYKI
ncbi:hypothetical protein NIES2101_10630 [Calothrix sp. HK-06]|nr:hypothetical protein NIES2101_10630 [Calothrix sp. HK-06]